MRTSLVIVFLALFGLRLSALGPAVSDTVFTDIPEPVEAVIALPNDTIDELPASILGTDTIPVAVPYSRFSDFNSWEEREVTFNPDPTRAVWMSALFPGLGQIYNRRYWKLPIVVGAYFGLGYATAWNNGMLTDYQRAYSDIMDSDPSTDSYKDFFAPTVDVDALDQTWLTSLLKSRKDYYRRYRDLCIICMVGVYFVAMVDAYVDASLSHFDISPDLSMDWSPTVIPDSRGKLPGIGVAWALNF